MIEEVNLSIVLVRQNAWMVKTCSLCSDKSTRMGNSFQRISKVFDTFEHTGSSYYVTISFPDYLALYKSDLIWANCTLIGN